MSKRIISFLIGILAASAAFLPTQAQQIKESQLQKANGFASLVGTDLVSVRADLVSVREGKMFADGNKVRPYRAPGEETNEHGIIVTPGEGVDKVYNRSGNAYYVQSQQLYHGGQSGTVRIVECEDGTVYVRDIISYYSTSAYVKGVREGNTITIPTGQPVNYNSNYNCTLGVYWGEKVDNSFVKNNEENIVFEVDGNTITLLGSSENKFIGVFWDDDDSFSGYGDYETVWVYNHDYVPASTDLIEPPANMSSETWNVKGVDISNNNFTSTCEVGFSGNDIYLKGVYSDFPDSWIKGTITNTTITFSGLQYLGEAYGYHIWSTGYHDNQLCDLVMDYDAAARVITLSPNYYMVANASEDRLYYLQMITGLTIQADAFVEHYDDPVLMDWRQVGGKSYELWMAVDETDYRTNPDGTKIPSWLSRPWAELPTKGKIGFQGMHGKARPYFRNIRIRPL